MYIGNLPPSRVLKFPHGNVIQIAPSQDTGLGKRRSPFKKAAEVVKKVSEVAVKHATQVATAPIKIMTAESPKAGIRQIFSEGKSLGKEAMDVGREVTKLVDVTVGKYISPSARHRLETSAIKDEIKSLQQQLEEVSAQLMADPENPALLAKYNELSERLNSAGQKLKKLNKRAALVLQIASIVASIFVPGVGLAFQSGIQLLKQGVIDTAIKLMMDAVSKAIGKKMSKRAANKLAREAANYAQVNSAQPDQAWFDRRVEQLLMEEKSLAPPAEPQQQPAISVGTDSTQISLPSQADRVQPTQKTGLPAWVIPAALAAGALFLAGG